ncbi:MAG: plasmid pRiA4b ORF-3 family protein [Alphaproteobacteria bacterium]|nr:plasmid pRiA4b ORF-3 family protein [Alphaproteobacteria bacterium]
MIAFPAGVRVGDASLGRPDLEGLYDGPTDAKKITLEQLLNQTTTRTIQYVYDFGDDWDHSIRIERVNEAAAGMTHPRLLKATGTCPPENIGGAWGFTEFFEALADPDHEQHEEMVQWSGGDFDAADAEIDSIIERFSRLAKKWAPQSRKPRQKRK